MLWYTQNDFDLFVLDRNEATAMRILTSFVFDIALLTALSSVSINCRRMSKRSENGDFWSNDNEQATTS